MGVTWDAAADDAGLRADIDQMLLVPESSGLAEVQLALVDPSSTLRRNIAAQSYTAVDRRAPPA
jgi:hypothetical protein